MLDVDLEYRVRPPTELVRRNAVDAIARIRAAHRSLPEAPVQPGIAADGLRPQLNAVVGQGGIDDVASAKTFADDLFESYVSSGSVN